MTERKGEPNRSVQRSNFPPTSTAKACGMPKTLKELWIDSAPYPTGTSQKLTAALPEIP
jgi:hypothetical protein